MQPISIGTLGNMLFYGSLFGLPAYAAGKRGLDNMGKSIEPLEVRLQRSKPADTLKLGSESYFNEFRAKRENTKVAKWGIPLSQAIIPSLLLGGALSSAVEGIGKGVGAIASPSADVIGYGLYKKMFPGAEGYIGMTRAPEKAFLKGTEQLAGQLSEGIGSGIQNFISKAIDRNKAVMQDSPRRKMIVTQLRDEDPLIGEMDMKRLMESYHTMVSTAPTLSLDKNAVKSFLRTIAVSPEGGIDWNTLKGLADAETSLRKAKGIE